MGRRPTVSVVIPCYNYGHYLPRAVASALDQQGVDVEVIVIDDASPDGSAAVARELAARHEQVRAVLHDQNRGHIATYNEGLEMVASDYVVLLSADDLLVTDSLTRATALLDAHPEVGFVSGHPVAFTDEPPRLATRVRSWTVEDGHQWLARRCQVGRNSILCPEVVMRTSVQHAIGGYRPELPHSGDFEMWLRAARVSDVGRVNGPDQACYRVHPDSMMRTVQAGHLNDLDGRRAAFEAVLLAEHDPVPNGSALYGQACRALAAEALALLCAEHDAGLDLPELDELTDFAVRLWPEATSSRRWRALQRRLDPPPLPPEALARATSQAVRAVRAKFRWRRWRWSGV